MTAPSHDDLEYPLSVEQLKRLNWLGRKIAAKCHLGLSQEYVSGRDASRLGFIAWLVSTGRLSEHGQ